MAQRTTRRARGWWRAGVLVCAVVTLAGCGSSGQRVVSVPSVPESTLPDTPTPTPPPTPTPAPDPPPTTPSAVIYGCDGQPAARPDSFILLCGDGGERLEGMTWSGWGGSTATATGQVWRKSCVPDCATGNVLPYPATVTVSGLNGGSYGSMRVDAPDSPTPAEEFTLDSSGPRVVQNG